MSDTPSPRRGRWRRWWHIGVLVFCLAGAAVAGRLGWSSAVLARSDSPDDPALWWVMAGGLGLVMLVFLAEAVGRLRRLRKM
ncbi:MAG: hypothetical protein RID91_09355 [Azospirillaceae bacterium]